MNASGKNPPAPAEGLNVLAFSGSNPDEVVAWRDVRGEDLSEIRPGPAMARMRTVFGERDLQGTILHSHVKRADGEIHVHTFFHSKTGVLRPLRDFEKYKLI